MSQISYYLTQDIVGSSSRLCFGKKGDKVKLFTNHDNVKIVENDSGFRFSVHESHLSKELVIPDVDKIVEKKKK